MTSRDRFTLRLKRAVRHTTPKHIVRTRLTQHVISNFADKIGLVYFGFVNQKDDEHRLVRGHTVSQTHVDSHYCIGTVRGYDVVLVSRNDVVRTRSGKSERCHWLIYTIDLHTKHGLPHCYVGHRSRDALFAAAYEQIYPITIGNMGEYPHRFLSEYTVYSTATHTLDVERIIPPTSAEVIMTHFSNASFEIEDGTIFLYVESEHPNEQLLDKLLSNGLWLAESIDAIMADKE